MLSSSNRLSKHKVKLPQLEYGDSLIHTFLVMLRFYAHLKVNSHCIYAFSLLFVKESRHQLRSTVKYINVYIFNLTPNQR